MNERILSGAANERTKWCWTTLGTGSHPAAPRVVAILAPKLTQYITSSVSGGGGGGNGKDAGDISGDCLDILNAMVSGYGTLMTVHHEPLKAALFAYLAESGKQAGHGSLSHHHPPTPDSI